MRLDPGQDHAARVERAQPLGEPLGVAAGEGDLLDGRDVVEEGTQLGQCVAEPLGVLLGD